MFYGRFKNDICLPNIDQDVCMLKGHHVFT